MGRQLDVVLRIAQETKHGKSEVFDKALQLIGRARARVDTHAEDADARRTIEQVAIGQLGKESLGRIDVEE